MPSWPGNMSQGWKSTKNPYGSDRYVRKESGMIFPEPNPMTERDGMILGTIDPRGRIWILRDVPKNTKDTKAI